MGMSRSGWVALGMSLVVAALPAAACSRSERANASPREERPAACVKEGDRCEFAPGKIGLCTAKVGSTGGPLTCVSLH